MKQDVQKQLVRLERGEQTSLASKAWKKMMGAMRHYFTVPPHTNTHICFSCCKKLLPCKK